MNRRKSWLPALVLLLGGVGCMDLRAPSLSPDNRKESDLAQRSPEARKSSARLFVAYAQMQENKAADEKKVPEQTQQMLREEARQAYLKALEAEPKNVEALVGLGRVASFTGDEDRAKQYFSKATQLYPQSAGVWYEVGMYHCKHKAWAPALECLGRSYQLDPQNREIATKYGLTLARAGQTDQSIACLTKIMGQAQAHYTVARMLAHLNQVDMSKQHLQAALQYQPDLEPARELLVKLESGQRPSTGPAGSGVVNIRFDQPNGAE